jgi:hypothetical protein
MVWVRERTIPTERPSFVGEVIANLCGNNNNNSFHFSCLFFYVLALRSIIIIISGLDVRDYGRGDPLRWPRDTLCPQKLALTSPKSGDCLVGVVRSRSYYYYYYYYF